GHVALLGRPVAVRLLHVTPSGPCRCVRWSRSCSAPRSPRGAVLPDSPSFPTRHRGSCVGAGTTRGLTGRMSVEPGSEQAGDHLLGGRGEALLLLLEVGLPGRERPDLEAVECADDGAFPVQPRVGATVDREGDAALPVRD